MFSRAIIFVLGLLGSTGAWLEAGGRAQAQSGPRARVWLVLDANIEEASGLHEALAAQLADLDLEITTGAARGAVPAAALALARAHRTTRDRGVVWVARQDRDLLVFVVEPRAEKTLLRSLENADLAAYATQETLAVIVRSSIEGLLSGAPIGFVPPAAVAPAASPAPTRFVPELSAGYLGASFAPEVSFQHGARFAAGLSHLFSTGLYSQLALSLVRDARLVDQGVSLSLTRTPLEWVWGFRFEYSGWALSPELGAGLEWSRRDAQGTSASVVAKAQRTRISPLLSGKLWLLRALGGPLARSWLGLAAGVEALLNNVDYQVEIRRGSEPSTTSILVSPRSFRPIVLLALRVSL